MKKRYKVKKKVRNSFLLIIFVTIGIIFGIKKYNEYLYHQTNLYKLTTVGYTLDESKIIIDKLNNKNELYFIENKKNNYLLDILNEKYFLEKNLYDYLDYKVKNKNKSYSDIVAIVNVHANKDWYDSKTIVETNMDDGYLILVNKFHYLDKDYVPDDLENINLSYAYSENSIRKEANDEYINMAVDALKEGIQLLVNSSYRPYDEQDEIYKDFYYSKGISYADNYAARAGYSEHQTGLALDIFTPDYSTTDEFENSDAYKWLVENSYKYGFILRYPKDKEYLTGYNYESWHYRYVGKEIAEKIYKENITYDEYYAYYLEK